MTPKTFATDLELERQKGGGRGCPLAIASVSCQFQEVAAGVHVESARDEET